jgi:hypothetical protein
LLTNFDCDKLNINPLQNDYFDQITLDENAKLSTLQGADSSDTDHVSQSPDITAQVLYAHVAQKDGLQQLQTFFVHDKDSTIHANVKKAIARLLLTKPYSHESKRNFKRDGRHLKYEFDSEVEDALYEAPKSMYQPARRNHYAVQAELDSDHDLVRKLNAWQNVTFASRLYQEAHSKLHST